MAQDSGPLGTETMTGTIGFEPESPFISDVPVPASVAATAPGKTFAPAPAVESPFVTEYAGEEGEYGPQAEEFASLASEFYDPEFEEALEDLVNEASAVAEQQPSFESEDPAQLRLESERALRDYLEPLAEATEAMLDRLTVGLGDRDISQLSEAELDAVMEQLAPTDGGLSPAFEGFLGGMLKKARKAVHGALSKVMPHKIILNRLKGLVRPLLERVLRGAIDKLPVAVRPIAQQLAKHFLGSALGGDGGPGAKASARKPGRRSRKKGELAAADSSEIQDELDAQLAGYLVQGEDFERAAAVEQAVADQEGPTGDPIRELEQARSDFARQVTALDESEDPRPVVEQFVPAILAALKLGIRVIGRPKVVNFLAGMVAKLISKYVGKQQAVTLSRGLVDVGLRLVSLEAAEDPAPVVAGYTLASTVEDTVNRLVDTAPESAWEDEAVFEGYVAEAFQQAASAHFPDPMIRPELHEAEQASGAWVALPERTRRKLYKKYSRVLEVTITPQVAAAVRTFRGTLLRDFLRNRLGISTEKSVQARAHLYEAIPGTRLALIAMSEKKVPGLGNPRRDAWSLIQPLTPDAAGLLLKEPGLGRPVDAQFLARRGRVGVGQRFYFLEIQGARVRMAPRGRNRAAGPARTSTTSVVLDLPKRQLRVFVYYSEADGQELVGHMKRKLPLSALLTALRAKIDITKIGTGDRVGGIRIIHETMPEAEGLGDQLKGKLFEWLLDVLRRELEARYDRFAAEFQKALEVRDADGVSVIIVFQAPPLLERVRAMLKPGGLSVGLDLFGLTKASNYELQIRPGFAYW